MECVDVQIQTCDDNSFSRDAASSTKRRPSDSSSSSFATW